MERLQKSKQKNRSINRSILIFFLLIICNTNLFSQQKKDCSTAFFRSVDSILFCNKKFNYSDTISFIESALISYWNNQKYSNFDDFFKCQDIRYTNTLSKDSTVSSISITSTYGPTDNRLILLFYLENYLISHIIHKSNFPKSLNVYAEITLKGRNGKSVAMGKGIEEALCNKIFKKLIKIYNNEKFLNKLLYNKKISPLSYLGYTWTINGIQLN